MKEFVGKQGRVEIWKKFVDFQKSCVHYCLALQCGKIMLGGEVGVSIGGLGFAEGGRVGGICGFS